jgi:hypothetical protein
MKADDLDAVARARSSCPASRRASRRVLRAWNIRDLRAMAKRRLPRAVFDFFDGAAEDEITLAANRAAFERVRLLPRMLTGVERVDTSTTLLGARSKMPIAVGPTGGIGFGWPFADVGVARAAAAAGIPYTLSTMATASIERIAREAGGRLWFQAYIFRDPKMTAGLVERARAFGYEALMVTVDSGSRRATCSISPRAPRGCSTSSVTACRSWRTCSGSRRRRRAPPRSPPRSGSSGTPTSTGTT